MKELSQKHNKLYTKNLSQCLQNIKPLNITGSTEIQISSIEYDSRKVKKTDNIGVAFFALSGIHTDGKAFIEKAIEAGAICVFYEGEYNNFKPEICYIQVEKIRSVMALVSAEFYDHPSKKIGVIGVTGTEGKSSTVSFIFQLLNLCGQRAGFFSTVEYSIGKEVIPNPEHQTTPESNIVQKRLAQMQKNNCKYAVVESSSHGLSPLTARLENVFFDVGVFLNVTKEHLEFHKTPEQYRCDKANLFRALDANFSNGTKNFPIFGIVNYEDPNANYFIDATAQPVYCFSTNENQRDKISKLNGYLAIDIEEYADGIKFTIQNSSIEYEAFIKLAGRFNVQNVLAAIICVHKITGIALNLIIEKLPYLKPVKGRMQKINEGQEFEVIIDYAHTPSSFEALFPQVAERAKKNGGKVFCVFGSGGERDLQKRPEQGRIASFYSDIVILADEDPRGEDPIQLLQMIAEGCKNKSLNNDLFIIPERAKAIAKAISLAQKNDIVLLLGKSHENSIIYKDKIISYDEETTVRRILKKIVN